MEITKRQLARCAEKLLQGLRNKRISSLEVALNTTENELEVGGVEYPAIIHIQTHNLDYGTTTLKILYEEKIHYGTPIELSINRQLDYRLVFVRCAEPLKEYSQRGCDRSGHILQHKKSKGAEWNEVIKDLEELSRLT